MVIKGDGPQFYEPVTVFLVYITGQFVNASHFSNQDLDKLYDLYVDTVDRLQQITILEKMEEVVAREVPLIPLYYPFFRIWHRPDININNGNSLAVKPWEFPYHSYKRYGGN